MVAIPEPVEFSAKDHFDLKQKMAAKLAVTEAGKKLTAFEADSLCDILASQAFEFFAWHKVIKGTLGEPRPA